MKIVESVGGLGSQMFAFGLYLELKKRFPNERVIYDTEWFNKNVQHNGEELERVFGISMKNVGYHSNEKLLFTDKIYYKIVRKLFFDYKRLHDAKHNFVESYLKYNGNARYFQCWSTPKYFKSVVEEIKDIFQFKELTDEQNLGVLKKIETSESVSIHVRRGDYVNNFVLGGLASVEFYNEAITYMESNVKNARYFVFSDDIEWCKNELRLNNAEYVDWNKGEESYKDMQLMSMCKHNIIPNSSFSWWGAFLNKNKLQICVCPERWSNPETGVEVKDLPGIESWITIKNY